MWCITVQILVLTRKRLTCQYYRAVIPCQEIKLSLLTTFSFFYLCPITYNRACTPILEVRRRLQSCHINQTFQNLKRSHLVVVTSHDKHLPHSSPTIHFRIWQFSHHTFQILTVLPPYISESDSSPMIRFSNLTVLPWYVSVILQFSHDTFQ